MPLRRVMIWLQLAAVLPLVLFGQGVPVRPLDAANRDSTCKACDDFFQSANGAWVARTTIPSDVPAWGSFRELQEANHAALKQTLEQAAADAPTTADSNRRKLGFFYATCLDSGQAARDGARPLEPELKRIAAIRSPRDVQGAFVRFQQLAIGAPFTFFSAPDFKNSTRVIAMAYQGGVGLPDRDYYTRTDSGSVALRAQYVDHVGRIFRLLGGDGASAEREARTVMRMETALALASMTNVEQRNPDSLYHLMKLANVKALAPALDWDRYLAGLGLRGVGEINVAQPKFLQEVDSLLRATPVGDWKTYLRWQLVHKQVEFLGPDFDAENFRFYGTILRGVAERRPLWKRCINRTDDALGEILGQAFVATHFTPQAKARALEMVQNIQAAFRRRLAVLTWMSDPTKAKAYIKLDAIVNKIGYPDKWRDYSALQILPGPFVLNAMRAAEFEVRRDFAKIGKPVDRGEWGMTPALVNAQYNPQLNDITFPAGIMQPPFFNPDADDAVNYGGMGAVIGHEITHGFDDEGRKFDSQGNLSGWWSDADNTEFQKRADAVATQFDGYVAVDSLHVNGRLTLGENIADFGGLTIAYTAYRKTLDGKPEPAPIDGLTGDQRFFLAWAQIWKEVYRPAYTRLIVNSNPHSPPRFRVNGPLSNMPEFAQAFHCAAGDPMVRPEGVRAEIW